MWSIYLNKGVIIMSIIMTIVRESERNGGRLSFKKYKGMTAEARGASLATTSFRLRHKFNLGKPRVEKQEERQTAVVVEQKKQLSFWQKAKNFFSRKGR
jgi:hypothetical protein